jgi:hypothetical protein
VVGCGRDALGSAGLADCFGGAEHAAAREAEQRRAVGADERREFLVERLERGGELADACDLVARDPDRAGARQPGRGTSDAAAVSVGCHLAAGAAQQRGSDRAAASADQPGALADQAFAVVDQLADLERPAHPATRPGACRPLTGSRPSRPRARRSDLISPAPAQMCALPAINFGGTRTNRHTRVRALVHEPLLLRVGPPPARGRPA